MSREIQATNEVANVETSKAENQVKSFDLTQPLPNLQNATALPTDLTSEYWTPETEGEFKLCFFQGIKVVPYTDEKTGESINLPSAIFIVQKENGDLQTMRNGSKRLVASLEDANIEQGTPLKIEFKGKIKNSTNGFMSDRWSIKPLLV